MTYDKQSYIDGLKSAIDECEAEIEAAELEFANMPQTLRGARSSINNAIQLIRDKIVMTEAE